MDELIAQFLFAISSLALFIGAGALAALLAKFLMR